MDKNKITEFWNETFEKAAKQPLEVIDEPLNQRLPFYVRKISYRSLFGARINAFLSLPITGEGSSKGKFPAILSGPGYGGWEQSITLHECMRGYIIMQVFPRDQGESGGSPKGGPKDGPWYLLRGIQNPSGYYYQGAFIDFIKAVDYLVSRSDVNPERIGFMGTSQAGGIALSVAGLDTRIKAVVAHLPFFCDMRHNPAFKDSELLEPSHLATFDYFDPVNLAPRSNASVLMSSGGRDTTCPPETIMAVFNLLPGIKALVHYPDLSHTTSINFYNMAWEWMDRYLKQQTG